LVVPTPKVNSVAIDRQFGVDAEFNRSFYFYLSRLKSDRLQPTLDVDPETSVPRIGITLDLIASKSDQMRQFVAYPRDHDQTISILLDGLPASGC
jgi:hypothetical protein